jgi:hypothetical protein
MIRINERQSRREFCIQAGTTGAAAFFAMNSNAQTNETNSPCSVPEHLPRKLAVCSSQWAWFTLSGPNEPYHNLEAVMIGLKERNYNAIRIDAALPSCFQKDGSLRGKVAIRATIPGYSHRLLIADHKGGNSVDILSRLIQFMELAKKYDIYVVLTDFAYMHTTWFLESEALRDEIAGIPEPERLIHLARHMDRLVTMLKEKDLAGNIAWIEPANEVDISDFPKGKENTRLHTEAVAFLRDRHPDILVSASLAYIDVIGTIDNAQVYDHHLYVGKAIYNPFYEAAGNNIDNPMQNELLKELLEPNFTPFSVFRENFPLGDNWLKTLWAMCNANVNKLDRWLTEKYRRDKASLYANARDYYTRHSQEAKRRGLPMVITEGGFFAPPLYSRFDLSESGLEYLDYLTDLSIKNDVWAFAILTFNCPATPVWWASRKWLTETNKRFLNGIVKGETQ